MRVTEEEKQKLKDMAEKFGFDYEDTDFEGKDGNCGVGVTFCDETREDYSYYSCSIDCEDGKKYVAWINDYADIEEAINAFEIAIMKDAFVDGLIKGNVFNTEYFRALGGEENDSYQKAIKTNIKFAHHEGLIRLLETGRIDLEELMNWMVEFERQEEEKRKNATGILKVFYGVESRCRRIIENWILKQKLTSELSIKDAQTKRLKI